jgi:bifunctional DNA-binding transcriptional regulator/antitoxin component of YhaV-PrlF toxin-antitoxin module
MSFIVKNRRLKVSPGGLITLPVSARKGLAMERGQGTRVDVAVRDGVVILTPAKDESGYRVSAGGNLLLRSEARDILSKGAARHYWIDSDDEARTVKLVPFA